ncbi:related to engulfment and cell motility gene 1protein [Lichtheimia corymbifera JMRC:FSU:9682]|uniref:Related to engulfment and cell motility gene 1protein n=1 Tax=Lichtheimia corymbifera JMRC:FSU:9682 TaxID=1263082 RepID=A0A068RHE6_9FUNG|nr:related to engulfment and cell motility gene 1protein [Lichtheimia corymbifera JMRC:FSU:9682]
MSEHLKLNLSVPPLEEAETLVRRMSGVCLSAANTAGWPSSKDEKVLKLVTFSLQKYLKEPDFATEFLERGGLEALCDIIDKVSGNTLAYALNSFTALIEQDDNVLQYAFTDAFVARIADIVVSETLATICRPATSILIQAISNKNATCGYKQVMQQQPESLVSVLIQRLQSSDYILCLNSLTLLVSLLQHVPDDHRSRLLELMDLYKVYKYVHRLMNNDPSEDVREQLLKFQSAIVHNANRRCKTQISMQHPRHVQMLQTIWTIAKVQHISVSGAKKWRKLGFSSETPHREFGQVGVFGLERMHAFANQNQNLFAKMVLEQVHRADDKRCPFAKASIEVTELLCHQWNISTGYSAVDFDPLLLHFDHVHATTLQCFWRLFQEMNGTTSDFSKVSALVRSQLRATMMGDEGARDIFEFDRLMLDTPYTVIRDRRLKELEWADDLCSRIAIRNLRSRLNRQSYDFLRRQRIGCLLQGAWFPYPTSHRFIAASSTSSLNSSIHAVGRRWRYYKLCPSKKYLQYGDFTERYPPIIDTFESLPHKVDLGEVATIQPFQRRSSAISLSGGESSSSSNPSFALFSEEHLPLAEFICASREQASEWKDGFSMLLHKGISTKETSDYLHSLADIGIKVKLLQIAGDRIEVPHGHMDAPPVPPGLGSGFFYSSSS